jgi:hypothetical protein
MDGSGGGLSRWIAKRSGGAMKARSCEGIENERENINMLWIIILLLCFGSFGTHWGWNTYGAGYGSGIGISTLLLIILVVWLLSGRN